MPGENNLALITIAAIFRSMYLPCSSKVLISVGLHDHSTSKSFDHPSQTKCLVTSDALFSSYHIIHHDRMGFNHLSAFSNCSITSFPTTVCASLGLGPCSSAKQRMATITYSISVSVASPQSMYHRRKEKVTDRIPEPEATFKFLYGTFDA